MIDANEMKANWEAEDRFIVETAYKEIMTTRTGRAFLYYLLEVTKFMQQPFNGQALGTAFACGEQNVGKRIMSDLLSIDPDAFVTLMKEANDVNRSRGKYLTAANAGADPYSYTDPDA